MYKTTTTSLGKSFSNSLISHRFEVAYKNPVIEALFYPSIYIYPCGSQKKFNVGIYIYACGSQKEVQMKLVLHYQLSNV